MRGVNLPMQVFGSSFVNPQLVQGRPSIILDKIDDMLPGWTAGLMNIAGRAILVSAILTAIPVCTLLVLDVPKWFIKAINKRRRAFLWKGWQNVQGGHYVVAWQRVCRSHEFCGLGIHNMVVPGWSLKMRWL